MLSPPKNNLNFDQDLCFWIWLVTKKFLFSECDIRALMLFRWLFVKYILNSSQAKSLQLSPYNCICLPISYPASLKSLLLMCHEFFTLWIYRPGETPPQVRRYLTIPVVLGLSYKREVKKQWDSIGRRNLACQPLVWQVRCFSPYKQALSQALVLSC